MQLEKLLKWAIENKEEAKALKHNPNTPKLIAQRMEGQFQVLKRLEEKLKRLIDERGGEEKTTKEAEEV